MNDGGALGLVPRRDNLPITWKSPKPRRGGLVVRYKRAHCDINIDRGVRVEDCATTEKMIVIPTLKPLAQGGVRFLDFHTHPALRRFSQIFISDRFWRTAGAFVKSAIFFKLQAVLCPLCPPRPPHARATPAPRPRRTQFDHLKSLYYGGASSRSLL